MHETLARPSPEALAPAVQSASQLLKTLGNERRIMILCHLAEGEHSVGALEGLLGMRQPALSQQLARLREEGIVATRRESRTIYYRLACPRVESLLTHLCRLYAGSDCGGGAGRSDEP